MTIIIYQTLTNPEFQNILLVEGMLLKIIQIIRDWMSEARSVSYLAAVDIILLRPFIIILIITLLSYQTVDLFYKIICFNFAGETDGFRRNVALDAVAGNRKQARSEDYGIIIERNLFQSTLKAVQDNESDIELLGFDNQTANFDLKGTVVCDSSFGYIFIEEHSNKKQKLCRLGDIIGSAKLIKIARNTAILRSGGWEIKLMVTASASAQSSPNLRPRNFTLDRKIINNKLGNLNDLMKQAIVRPFVSKGIHEGFVISNIHPGSLYEKMGLQNGDVLIDINDKKIKGFTTLLQAANLIQSGKNIVLNIKRNGKEENINYTFE